MLAIRQRAAWASTLITQTHIRIQNTTQAKETYAHFWLPSEPTLVLNFYFPIQLLSSTFFSLCLLVVTQIWRHIAGSSSLSPLRFVPCFLSREYFSSFPRWLTSNCAYPSYARSAIYPYIFANKSKSHHGRIRTPGPTLVAFDGYY